jgi:hypothetical protein
MRQMRRLKTTDEPFLQGSQQEKISCFVRMLLNIFIYCNSFKHNKFVDKAISNCVSLHKNFCCKQMQLVKESQK